VCTPHIFTFDSENVALITANSARVAFSRASHLSCHPDPELGQVDNAAANLHHRRGSVFSSVDDYCICTAYTSANIHDINGPPTARDGWRRANPPCCCAIALCCAGRRFHSHNNDHGQAYCIVLPRTFLETASCRFYVFAECAPLPSV
jgi:hypothetical protein